VIVLIFVYSGNFVNVCTDERIKLKGLHRGKGKAEKLQKMKESDFYVNIKILKF
jgi:hypothetical protein